jgi:hypothetical protein
MLMRVLELHKLMDDRGALQDLIGAEESVPDTVYDRDLV